MKIRYPHAHSTGEWDAEIYINGKTVYISSNRGAFDKILWGSPRWTMACAPEVLNMYRSQHPRRTGKKRKENKYVC